MSAFQQAHFLSSAATVTDFPPEAGPELAFAGRSNVGKSSAINALAGRKRLAFSSKTPGRTQMINFFDLGDAGPAGRPARATAMPAFPQALRASWDALIGGYLTGRRSLVGVVVLMDARRPLTANDRNFLEWLRPVGCAAPGTAVEGGQAVARRAGKNAGAHAPRRSTRRQ